jgi:hypothetical protein
LEKYWENLEISCKNLVKTLEKLQKKPRGKVEKKHQKPRKLEK